MFFQSTLNLKMKFSPHVYMSRCHVNLVHSFHILAKADDIIEMELVWMENVRMEIEISGFQHKFNKLHEMLWTFSAVPEGVRAGRPIDRLCAAKFCNIIRTILFFPFTFLSYGQKCSSTAKNKFAWSFPFVLGTI